MLGFLKRLFNSSRGRDPATAVMASEDLDRIERELEKTKSRRDAARLLNRAGDLHLVRGDRPNALKRYGDAIDAYLQAGEYDNAMAVCRKIIRVVPEVIRTRRTLAWLCLGKGFLEIAREHIEAYASASKEAGLQSLAVQHLLLMAQYVDRPEFREFLAAKLDELGDEGAAHRVREGRASEGVKAAGWSPVVFAAMLTPEELRQAADRGIEIKAPTENLAEGVDVFYIDPEFSATAADAEPRPSEAASEEDTRETGSE